MLMADDSQSMRCAITIHFYDASPGAWRSKLRPESGAEIESAWGNITAQLGYELVTRKAESAETQLAVTAVPGGQRG